MATKKKADKDIPKIEEIKTEIENQLPDSAMEDESVKNVPPKKKSIEPTLRPESDKSLPIDVRIKAFLKSRGDTHAGFVRLNDFLKSLYPLPLPGSVPEWQRQGNMKQLRLILETMARKGEIELSNNLYTQLGRHYYGGDTPETHYYHVGNSQVEAKLTHP